MIVKLNGKYDVQALELPAQEEGEEGAALAEGMEEVEGERERESLVACLAWEGRGMGKSRWAN